MEILDDRSVTYQLEVYKKWYEEQQEEIERLNNIINELVLECYNSSLGLGEFSRIWRIAFNEDYEPNKIDKLKELKEK